MLSSLDFLLDGSVAASHEAAQQFLSLQASEMLHHRPPVPADSSPVTMHPNLVTTLKSILSPGMAQDPSFAGMLPVVSLAPGDHIMVDASQQLSHHMQGGSIVRGGAGHLMPPAGADMLHQPDLAGTGLQYLLGINASNALVPDPNSQQAAVCAELEYMARASQFLRHHQHQQQQHQQNACCQADMMMKQMCHEQQQQQQLASFHQQLELQQNNVVTVVDHHMQAAFSPNVTVVEAQQRAELDVLARCNMMQEAMKFDDMMMQSSKHLLRSCPDEQQQSASPSSQDFQYASLCLPDPKFDDKVAMVQESKSFCSGSELDLVVCGELNQLNQTVNMVAGPETCEKPLFVSQFDEPQVGFDRGVTLVPMQEPPVLQSLSASSNSSNSNSSSSQDQLAAVIPLDLIQNRRPFRCTHAGCNKTFKNPQTMRMHRKTHAPVGSSSTAASQAQSSSLSAICKAGQNKKIPCRCPICKRTFVGLYELRRHFGRKHTQGEKRHACRKCGKRFYIEVDLRDHEKICGEPMECKCGMKFAFKCNLVAHKKAHPECQDVPVSSSSASASTSSEEDKSRTLSKALSTLSGFCRYQILAVP